MSPTSKSSKYRPSQPVLTTIGVLRLSSCAERFGERHSLTRPIHDRKIKQLAAEGDGAMPAGAGLVEGLQHFARIGDVFCRRREGGVRLVDLTRVNDRDA